MNPQQPSPEVRALLEKLHNIEVPDPVSWWPPAPGWWIVALLVLALLAGITVQYRRLHQRQLYRKAGLEQLAQIDGSDSQAAQAISALLKRVALTAWPQERTRIAPLFGESWVQFLNASCDRHVFNGSAADLLAKDLYRPVAAAELAPLKHQAEIWIKHHRNHPPAPPSAADAGTDAGRPEPSHV